jgi:flagellar basal body-associated protein FliL
MDKRKKIGLIILAVIVVVIAIVLIVVYKKSGKQGLFALLKGKIPIKTKGESNQEKQNAPPVPERVVKEFEQVKQSQAKQSVFSPIQTAQKAPESKGITLGNSIIQQPGNIGF